VVDAPTALIGAAALALLFAPRRIPEPFVILLGAAAGLLIHHA
jgi:hypothetical protein